MRSSWQTVLCFVCVFVSLTTKKQRTGWFHKSESEEWFGTPNSEESEIAKRSAEGLKVNWRSGPKGERTRVVWTWQVSISNKNTCYFSCLPHLPVFYMLANLEKDFDTVCTLYCSCWGHHMHVQFNGEVSVIGAGFSLAERGLPWIPAGLITFPVSQGTWKDVTFSI